MTQQVEFHNSQQSSAARRSTSHSKKTKAMQSNSDASLNVFNALVDESKFEHLHQLAGWVDIEDASVWHDYVADVMDGLVKDGDTVFEAGCGVLAFLTSVKQLAKLGAVGGMDGAAQTIKLVQDKLIENSQRDNFYVGLMPSGLSVVQDSSWDVVFCNSVMQYIPSEDDCRASVQEMLRITKHWVVIADICDAMHEERTKEHKKRLSESNAADGKAQDEDAMVDYKCYDKSWWQQFAAQGHLVTIRHVRTKSYTRRSERYCVYIEKNAGIPTSASEGGEQMAGPRAPSVMSKL
jgi:2-polyprenyl-3-methyl-5-hydroxy-6-metoxy-1,4-benzoquinol methylase